MKVEAMILFYGGNEILAKVMINLGAAGNFVDTNYVLIGRIPTVRKRTTIPLISLNREKLNEGIIHYTKWINMVLGNYLESIYFDVTNLGGYEVVLGILWLRQHSLRIDWRRDEIYFDYCECIKTDTI